MGRICSFPTVCIKYVMLKFPPREAQKEHKGDSYAMIKSGMSEHLELVQTHQVGLSSSK